MIRAAEDFGVVAGRNSMNRGVWVANKKLGSIGITIRRGVTFHGIAFNVNLSLEPFDWINPCGLKGIGMTSIERELSYQLSMREVREAVMSHMETVFGIEFKETNLSEINALLKSY
ncbi:MAG TPA: hypothetical protein DDW42_02935 [Desulfobacteraceae bacterium]|nr:hypothetical protein [Desulfobacteraceae bacterium]